MFSRFLIILTVLAVLTPAVASAQSQSSSACLALPTDTVLQWKNLYPCCGDERDCRIMCGAWLKTCANMANASYRCFYMLFRSLTALDLSECTVIDDPMSKADCMASARSNQESAISSLSDDLDEAAFTCTDCLGACLDFCED